MQRNKNKVRLKKKKVLNDGISHRTKNSELHSEIKVFQVANDQSILLQMDSPRKEGKARKPSAAPSNLQFLMIFYCLYK